MQEVVLAVFLCWNMNTENWNLVKTVENYKSHQFELFNYDMVDKHKVEIVGFDPKKRPLCKRVEDESN